MSRYGYLEVINSLLEFEITRVDCIWLFQNFVLLIQFPNDYCAFNIFLKVIFFCLTLYTEEVNWQTFMIQCKTFCRNYLCTKSFILFSGIKKI